MKLKIRVLALIALFFIGSSAWAMQTYGPTRPNETLWSIASRHHPAKVSVEQAALAIVKLNPKAFKGADYILKSHSYLRLPTTSSEVKTVLGLTVAGKHSDVKPVKAIEKSRKIKSQQVRAEAKKPAHNLQSFPQETARNQQAALSAQAQIAQLTQQLASANQQIAVLRQQTNDNNDDSFPWASLWFIVWALTAISLYMMHRHYKASGVALAKNNPENAETLTEKTEPIIISVSEKQMENPFEQGELDIPVADTLASEEMSDKTMDDEDSDLPEEIPATPEIQALLEQIETDPYNLELRMDILDLYANANDQAGFSQQSKDMVKHNLMMEGDEIWVKVRALYLNTWVYA